MFSRVYLDYNATTPLHPELHTFVTENLSRFGNPSSVHWAGREAKKLITQARENIAKLLNCSPLEIIFTAGGSESNNLALKGVVDSMRDNGRDEIICSTVEHPSVLKTVKFLAEHGMKIRWLNVKKNGAIDLDEFEKMLSAKTALVTVQLVNNETGNIFPLKKIAKRAHDAGALVHSDMVQGLGKIPIDLRALGVDMASFAGHKFYSMKGSGFLYVKTGVKIEPLIHGGGQERSRRAGTENALAIGALGQAAKILGPRVLEMGGRLEEMRDKLQARILAEIPGSSVNGGESPRAPNTLNITLDDIDGETLLINLDTKGFAVSSGAACSSGSQEPSPVLTAMGLSTEEASQSLRMSLGWLTTPAEVESFFEILKSSVSQMREIRLQARTEEAAEGEAIW